MNIVQMFYDAMNVGQCLRRCISLNLGFWHTWKYLVGRIWYHFADEVFAPLQRILSPRSNFLIAAKSPLSQTVMLVCIKEAYFAGPGEHLRECIDDDDFENQALEDQALLLDLYFLFECAIVVVPSTTTQKKYDTQVRVTRSTMFENMHRDIRMV